MSKLLDVEGIGPVYAQKLKDAGIGSTDTLLKIGSTPKGRQEIADKSGIAHSLILEWVNHVDLFRIKGVHEEYSDLLEEAGVDTVPELAKRNADHLFDALVKTNLEKKLVRKMPTKNQVADWIEQAKKLPRALFY